MLDLILELSPHCRRAVENAVHELGGKIDTLEPGAPIMVRRDGEHELLNVCVPDTISAEEVRSIDGVVGVYANPRIEPFSMEP